MRASVVRHRSRLNVACSKPVEWHRGASACLIANKRLESLGRVGPVRDGAIPLVLYLALWQIFRLYGREGADR
jgi:hypothetical protein